MADDDDVEEQAFAEACFADVETRRPPDLEATLLASYIIGKLHYWQATLLARHRMPTQTINSHHH
jgi:hypothetical protein